jgi:hypothetical protein
LQENETVKNMYFKSKLLTGTLALTFIFQALLVLSALPAQAHSSNTPASPELQRTSDMTIAFATAVMLGIAFYFGLQLLVSLYEKRKKVFLDEKAIKSGSLVMTAGVVLLLWRLTAPAPTVQASAGHVDIAQHGGQIQAVGDNHLEAVVSPNRSVALYVMGITETIPSPVTARTLWAKVKPEGQASGAPDEAILLHAAPLAGEPKGQASVFTGEVPPALAGRPVLLAVSVPLSGQEQQVSFSLDPHGAASSLMPAHDSAATRVAATPITPAEQALFLKPGGGYTAADIAANGGLTPEQKFQGLMANHHLNPKKGAFICPITKTQANEKFAWVVSGKKYLFCCPPCVTEFVKQAKLHPGSLKSPQSYIQM